MAKEAARTQPDRAAFTDVSFAPVQPSSANRKSQHCILAVSLGGGGFSQNPWQASLLGMAPVKPVYDPKAAVELLSGPNPPPSMIFIRRRDFVSQGRLGTNHRCHAYGSKGGHWRLLAHGDHWRTCSFPDHH